MRLFTSTLCLDASDEGFANSEGQRLRKYKGRGMNRRQLQRMPTVLRLTTLMVLIPTGAWAGVLVLGISDAAVNDEDSAGIAGHAEMQFSDVESRMSPTLSVSWHVTGNTYSYSTLSLGARLLVPATQSPHFVAAASAGIGNQWGGASEVPLRFLGLQGDAAFCITGKIGAFVPMGKRLSWVPTVGLLWMAGADYGGVGVFFKMIALGIDVGD